MEKEKKNTGLIITIVVLLILVLGLVGYLVYDKVLNKDTEKSSLNEVTESNEVTKDDTNEKNVKLDINSDLVQKLYSYVKTEKEFLAGMNYLSLFESKNEVYAKDFKQDVKNFLGYRQLTFGDLVNTECPTSLKSNNTCGSLDTTQYASSYALAFDGDDLKESVEKIFGPNSYKAQSFLGCKYLGNCVYDSTTNKYFDSDANAGGTGWNPTIELKSAQQTGNIIEINEYVVNSFEQKKEYNFKYIFEKAKDGNYYLNKVELAK